MDIYVMDYSYHYNKLISTRMNRELDESVYYEKHHIIPRSEGGTDSDDNLVFLTAREHFIAHWLLWRIYRNRASAFAFKMMCEKRKDGNIYSSSRAYAEAKESLAFLKGTSPMKGRTMTDEHKQKIISSRRKTLEERKLESGITYKLSEDSILKIKIATAGENNPMYGTSFYKKWVEKYGKEEADKRKYNLYKNRENKGRTKKLKFISPTGQEIIIEGKMKQFCKENNLNYGRVSQVINGKRETEKGWKIYEI